ncbi:hypothetical protein FOA52_007031 [Chlamydomonas sp. UWO 241]|nr:hypothetical protein FOA52_007031 [Chlamydomonas sp. UWO 241]
MPESILTLSVPMAREDVALSTLSAKGALGKHAGNGTVWGYLIYLQSYRGVGSARLSCRGACECEVLDINGHTDSKVSVPALASFKMESAGAADAKAAHDTCLIDVEALGGGKEDGKGGGGKDSGGGGEGGGGEDGALKLKFKVIGLTTSAVGLWHIQNTFREGIRVL